MITSSNTPKRQYPTGRITPEIVNMGLTSLENNNDLTIDLYNWLQEPAADLLPSTLMWKFVDNKWQAAWREG